MSVQQETGQAMLDAIDNGDEEGFLSLLADAELAIVLERERKSEEGLTDEEAEARIVQDRDYYKDRRNLSIRQYRDGEGYSWVIDIRVVHDKYQRYEDQLLRVRQRLVAGGRREPCGFDAFEGYKPTEPNAEKIAAAHVGYRHPGDDPDDIPVILTRRELRAMVADEVNEAITATGGRREKERNDSE